MTIRINLIPKYNPPRKSLGDHFNDLDRRFEDACDSLYYKLSNISLRKPRKRYHKDGIIRINLIGDYKPEKKPVMQYVKDGFAFWYESIFDKPYEPKLAKKKSMLERKVRRYAKGPIIRINLIGHYKPERKPVIQYIKDGFALWYESVFDRPYEAKPKKKATLERKVRRYNKGPLIRINFLGHSKKKGWYK